MDSLVQCAMSSTFRSIWYNMFPTYSIAIGANLYHYDDLSVGNWYFVMNFCKLHIKKRSFSVCIFEVRILEFCNRNISFSNLQIAGNIYWKIICVAYLVFFICDIKSSDRGGRGVGWVKTFFLSKKLMKVNTFLILYILQLHLGKRLVDMETSHELFSNWFSKNGWFNTRSQLLNLSFSTRSKQVIQFFFFV